MELATLDVTSLKLGQMVTLDGMLYTGRDRLHHYLASGGALPPSVDFHVGALYHCGPVVVPQDGGWHVLAAGPTTSSREELYEADVIRRFGLRVIIGKGGMGAKTLEACQACGCVYLQAVGGAASLIAATVEEVTGVDFLETFGAAEALWHFRVKGFPAVVAMDAHGHSLYDAVREQSTAQFESLLAK